jgi:hypothetical protein
LKPLQQEARRDRSALLVALLETPKKQPNVADPQVALTIRRTLIPTRASVSVRREAMCSISRTSRKLSRPSSKPAILTR